MVLKPGERQGGVRQVDRGTVRPDGAPHDVSIYRHVGILSVAACADGCWEKVLECAKVSPGP